MDQKGECFWILISVWQLKLGTKSYCLVQKSAQNDVLDYPGGFWSISTKYGHQGLGIGYPVSNVFIYIKLEPRVRGKVGHPKKSKECQQESCSK